MNGSIVVDVAVIGGGPAGLSAALLLGRSRRSCIVFDEERPRNRVTRAAHGFLTRDGITPGEFRQIARNEILAYPGVQFRSDIAERITGQNGAFTITTRDGAAIQAKKVLLATGLKDRLPAIPGFEAVYGQSAFVCPYCDGFERRDQALVLIPQGGSGHGLAKHLRGWSKDLTLCTNGPTTLTAAADGCMAAVMINHELLDVDWAN